MVCQECGHERREGDCLHLVAFRPSNSPTWQTGQARCPDHPPSLDRLATLGVREYWVSGRVGRCMDQARQTTWLVLLAPTLHAVSACDATTGRAVPTQPPAATATPREHNPADSNADPESGFSTDAGADAAADADADTDPNTTSIPESEFASEPQSQSGSAPETNSGPRTGSASESESKPEPERETELGAQSGASASPGADRPATAGPQVDTPTESRAGLKDTHTPARNWQDPPREP